MALPRDPKKELAHTIRRLYERGLVSGVGGNASVLLPGRRGLLITPRGYFKGGVAAGDLVKVDLDGGFVGGGRPSSEIATHLAAYRLRSDVRAVVHAHPPTAVGIMSARGQLLPMTPEHVVMVRNLQVVDFAPPGELGAKAVGPYLKKCDVVGIRNHGFFALGSDLHEAASRIEVIEESAKIYLAALQVGELSGISEKDRRKILAAYGHKSAG